MVLSAPVIYSLIVPIALARHLGHGLSGDLLSGLQASRRCGAAIIWFSTATISPISTSSRSSIAPIAPTPTAQSPSCARWRRAPKIYWCPIKHARRILGPHPHYQGFADFGDAEGFRDKIKEMKDGVKIEEASGAAR